MANELLIAKLRKYRPQNGYARNCYAAAAALEQLENALRQVMACAGDVQNATDEELQSAATDAHHPDTRQQARAWLTARAVLRPDSLAEVGELESPGGPSTLAQSKLAVQ